MANFYRKNSFTQAFQYTGTEESTVALVAFTKGFDPDKLTVDIGFGAPIEVNEGDWILKNTNNQFNIMSNKDFNLAYTPLIEMETYTVSDEPTQQPVEAEVKIVDDAYTRLMPKRDTPDINTKKPASDDGARILHVTDYRSHRG